MFKILAFIFIFALFFIPLKVLFFTLMALASVTTLWLIGTCFVIIRDVTASTY